MRSDQQTCYAANTRVCLWPQMIHTRAEVSPGASAQDWRTSPALFQANTWSTVTNSITPALFYFFCKCSRAVGNLLYNLPDTKQEEQHIS